MLEKFLKPENKEKLVEVLMYHIVSDTVRSFEFKDSMHVKNLLNAELKMSVKITSKNKKAHIQVNEAKIEILDVSASNGYIHIVDKVLLPV